VKNAVYLSFVGLLMVNIGCSVDSVMIDESGAVMDESGAEMSDSPEASPENSTLHEPEEVVCDTEKEQSNAPFGYDPDWCYTADHAVQCEWYVGPSNTKGCYESYTFYNNECEWIFQYDYCS